jgi:hypothetical protein
VTSAADVTSSAPEAGVLLLARRHRVWTALGLAARAGSDRGGAALFDSRRDPVPRLEWVIAGASWRQARTVGAQRVWVHAPYRQALWHLPAGR